MRHLRRSLPIGAALELGHHRGMAELEQRIAQARGDEPDHRSDLFSFGSVLYTMCTGVPPFRGANSVAVLRNVCEGEPQPIDQLNASGELLFKIQARGLDAGDHRIRVMLQSDDHSQPVVKEESTRVYADQ